MSWKDYFYFTKSQRIGFITLISLFVLIGMVKYIIFPHILVKEQGKTTDTVFAEQVRLFTDSLKEIKRVNPYYQTKRKEYRKEYLSQSNKSFEKETVNIELFPFNPNELDSVGFIRLGLKPFMASNILKYRAKGGKYKTTEQFGKLYGLSPEKFEELKPYIIIPVEEKTIKETVQLSPVEINSADTTALIQLKIPMWVAKKIISYRKQLGGYVSASQLNEIKGISPDLITRMQPFIEIDLTKIKKIKVNMSSIDRMRSHPYINFYQAEAIYDYRRNNGRYKSFEDLYKLKNQDITDEFLAQIKPYFDFSTR